MRSIHHPGPVSSQPVLAIPCMAETFDVDLAPGQTLLQAVSRVVEQHGLKSGVLRLSGGAFEHFCYYMPALSQSPDHAVYFSDRYDVVGQVSLESAAVTYGQREGTPWLHCHAVWIEPDGTRKCGHLIPDINQVVLPIHATVTRLDGAVFTVTPDAESNFSLFVPRASELVLHQTQARAAFAVRLAPNVDVCLALESLCREFNLGEVSILGGVGSTVGAAFADGRLVEPFVTEILIRHGRIMKDTQDQFHADIDVCVVDFTGGFSEGRLKRGENPVLVTFELVLQPK